MAAKVIRLRSGNFGLPDDPAESIPSAADDSESDGGGWPHSARHARAEGETSPVSYLPIRSVEWRRWALELMEPATAGLVLHGIGGIGKSRLAAEIAARVGRLEPDRLIAVITGEVSVDTFLAGLAAGLRRHPALAGHNRVQAEAVKAADRSDLPWSQRMALLREHVLSQVPVLVVLDGFDENLLSESGRCMVRDPALACLLAGGGAPRQIKLLITCRRPFSLPGTSGALRFRHLGPLSRSGAAALAAALPALGQLDEQELDRAWRLVGGHPRALEYLDALLATGQDGFPDVARRLAGALQERAGQPALRKGPEAPTGLPPATAETIAGIAGDLLLGELFGRLSADAQDLLIGASVYRTPVGCDVLLLPGDDRHTRAPKLAGLVAECGATGLLAAGGSDPPPVFVPRWTAGELHRRLAGEHRGDEITDAHRRAAEYWRQQIVAAPQNRRAPLEASYHLLQAGDLARQYQSARRGLGLRWRLGLIGLAAAAMLAIAFVAVQGLGAFSARPSAVPPGPPGPGVAAATGRAAAVRGQAAAWVAQQVSRDAMVACDPAMCAALQAQGVAASSLLKLEPSAPDPLGSDVVMATAAIRSQFGARLASVYAPAVLARFGSGQLRIDVRAVAADGAAAYRTMLAADIAARRNAGRQLLRNPRLEIPVTARGELAAGQVDMRLLTTLANLTAAGRVRVVALAGAGPGASAGVPVRAAEVTGWPRASPARLRRMLARVRTQWPPYRPARAAITQTAAGVPVLDILFPAPSLMDLLGTQPAPYPPHT
ncbi:MAG TPA: hypothetical protein VIX86_09215 [Streptosporangiaceae bacterium]